MVEKTMQAKPTVETIECKGIKLEPGELSAILELIVKDKDGRVTEHQVMKSRSFVRQFAELIFIAAARYTESTYSIRDTGNTVRACYAGSDDFLRCNALAGTVTNGIVVGTGVNAPTINDYALQTLIAHGVGAGQLQYSAVTFGAPSDDGSVSQFTITRDFANGSGGLVTVREIGLYVQGSYGAGTVAYFMTIRDAVNIGVANGQTLTVNYRIQATA